MGDKPLYRPRSTPDDKMDGTAFRAGQNLKYRGATYAMIALGEPDGAELLIRPFGHKLGIAMGAIRINARPNPALCFLEQMRAPG
jgi:hypothetical protein